MHAFVTRSKIRRSHAASFASTTEQSNAFAIIPSAGRCIRTSAVRFVGVETSDGPGTGRAASKLCPRSARASKMEADHVGLPGT
jgi:hypothetical protein